MLTPFTSTVIGLTLNHAAYMAEVFRSGIQAIPKGQWEAGLASGMSRRVLMRRIILPAAIYPYHSPAARLLLCFYLQGFALVSLITMRDLMFSGELPPSATYKYFEIFAMVAAIYLLISYPTAKFVEFVEAKLDIHRRPAAVQGIRAEPRGEFAIRPLPSYSGRIKDGGDDGETAAWAVGDHGCSAGVRRQRVRLDCGPGDVLPPP